MKNSILLVLLIVILAMGGLVNPVNADSGEPIKKGPCDHNALYYKGGGNCVRDMAPESAGGKEKPTQNQALTPVPGTIVDLTPEPGLFDAQWMVPDSAVPVTNMTPGQKAAIKANGIKAGKANGALLTGKYAFTAMATGVNMLAGAVNAPDKQMQAAKGNLDSQAMEMANALAELEKQQAASAIDFCSSFLTNFTTDGGNKWNKLRDNIFVPMAILLLLPGAVLTQVKSIVAAGNPVLGECNPWEGIQRSIIAIFLIPGTYLVVNYSIDLNNSITLSIADEYQQIFGTNMYRDAIAFHIRAFPARQPGENRNALDQQTTQMGPLLNGSTAFARFEGMMIENKIEDPVAGIYICPPDRADECLPSSVIAAKEMFNSTNCTFMIAWNILCAFQMIYFYYLWFVGPITAALWVWPMKQLRGAFPSWCEGVITLGFWSLFWNTSILLMACFRGVDETGTLVITALNFLATSSVKYAFDFAGLAKAAGQEAANMADKAMKAAQSKGGKGGGGGGGKGGGGSKSHGHGNSSSPHHNAHAAASPQRVADEGGGHANQPHRVAAADAPGGHRGAVEPTAYHSESGEGPVGNRGLLQNASYVPSGHGMNTPGHTTPDVGLPPSSHRGPDPSTGKADPNAPVTGNDDGDFTPPPLTGGSADVTAAAALASIHAHNAGHSQTSFDAHMLAAAAGFNHANAAGMHSTHVNGQGAVALGQHGLSVGADGKSFFATNNEGDNIQVQFDANGRATLPDGTVVQATNTDAGTELSVFNNGTDNPATDNYLVNSNCDVLNVAHSDSQHHPLDAIAMTSGKNGDLHAQAFDAHGHKTYSEDWNANNLKTTNYDQNGAVSGYGVAQNGSDGSTLTNYYDKDANALGASLYQRTDYGSMETNYDVDGNAVSMQQDVYNDDGSSSVTNASFASDGSVYNASLSNYDVNGQLSSSAPLDNKYAAALANDIVAIGHIPPMATFNDVSNNMSCPINSTYASNPGAGTLLDRLAASASNATPTSELSRPALDVTPQVWADSRGAVVPDGNVFANSVNNNATQDYSPTAYSQNIDNSYANPVTTSSVDVVPPINLGGTSDYAAAASSSEYSRQSTDANAGYAHRVDQDITNVQANDAAHRIAFDSSPTSYQPVDQSSVDYTNNACSTSSTLNYQAASSPSLMDQVLSAKNDAAFRAVEAHNIAQEVRAHVVPQQEAGGMVGTTGLHHDVQANHHQNEHHASAMNQTSEYSRQSFDAAPRVEHAPRVDQDVTTNVQTNDAAQRIAFDSSPTSYQPVDQSSVDYTSNNACSTSSTLNYQAASSPSLMDQVLSAKNDAAFRAVEAHNIAQEVRAHVVPQQESGGMVGTTGLHHDVQANHNQSEYYAASAVNQHAVEYSAPAVSQHAVDNSASTVSQHAVEFNAAPVTHQYQADQVTEMKASECAQRIAFDSSPTSYQSNDQSVEYTSSTYQPASSQSIEYSPTTHQAQPASQSVQYSNHQYSQQSAPSLMDQVMATRKDTAFQAVEAHNQASEIRSQIVPAPSHGKDVPVTILAAGLAASQLRQSLPPADKKQGGQPGLLSSILDNKLPKKKSPPQEVPGKTLTNLVPPQQQPAPSSTELAKPTSCDVPMFLGRMKDAVDGKSAIESTSTNQSLQQQMIDSGNHVQAMPGNAFSSALGRANAAKVNNAQTGAESLTNALIDYHTISSLIQEGKVNEAQAVASYALDNIAKCSGNEPQLLPLVQAFVTLFQQKGMTEQAKAFQEKEQTFVSRQTEATTGVSRNIWGA